MLYKGKQGRFQSTHDENRGILDVRVRGGRQSDKSSPGIRAPVASALAYWMSRARSPQKRRVEPQCHIHHLSRLRVAQHRAVESIEALVEHLVRHLHKPDDELPGNRARLAPKVHFQVAKSQRDDISLGGLGERGHGVDHDGPVCSGEIADHVWRGKDLREGCVVEVPAQWEVAVVSVVAWLKKALRLLASLEFWDDED